MQTEMHAQDLYLRHTAGDGKSYIAEHRVYDAELFLNAWRHATRSTKLRLIRASVRPASRWSRARRTSRRGTGSDQAQE